MPQLLTRPTHGWSDICIHGVTLGRVSYIDDVPTMLLDAFIQYFHPDNVLPFGISFDAEGWDNGFMEIAGDLYFFDTKTDSPTPNLTNLSEQEECSGKGYLIKMAKWFRSDLINDFQKWSEFSVFCEDKDERERQIEKSQENLRQKLRILDQLLDEQMAKISN